MPKRPKGTRKALGRNVPTEQTVDVTVGFESKESLAAQTKPKSRRKRNTAVFCAVVVVWLLVDLATKVHFNAFPLGEVVGGPFFGLFRFRLVHNTGMAWGMFSDSTMALGVLSLVVCVALTAYLFACSPRASLVQTLGVSLVVAGGIGNAIDRFSQGYVVDFIDLAFMDFPVFNVADIGVTCGFVLFLLGLLLEWRNEEAVLAVAATGIDAESAAGAVGDIADATASDGSANAASLADGVADDAGATGTPVVGDVGAMATDGRADAPGAVASGAPVAGDAGAVASGDCADAPGVAAPDGSASDSLLEDPQGKCD